MSMLRMTAMPQLYISCWIRFSWERIQCRCRVGICMLLLSKSFKRIGYLDVCGMCRVLVN